MKNIKYAVSVYEGLKDYPVEENFKYLEKCAKLGVKTVFTSAHIPESLNIQDELDKLTEVLVKNDMRLIIDVSKHVLETLNVPTCTYALRLDYGFTDQEIIDMSNNLFCNIELNASTISTKWLEEMVSKGLNPSKTRMSYNFYPKPYTGLDIYEMKEKNEFFHKLGFTIMAYIPSLINKRPPLYKGVPSIEEHRYKPTYISTQELLVVGVDEIGIGDAYSPDTEINEMINCSLDNIQIPVVLNEDLPVEILNVVSGPHHSRPDQCKYQVRSSSRCKTGIEPKNNNGVKAFDVTIDNSLNLRYTGEIGIWLRDIDELKEANVIGYIPSYAHDLIQLLKPGSKFSFKIVKE